ncbi:hypothetical protein CDEST_14528 [Colletotrichum destructivum]|uniref:Uncharacterized protein n=1 Tax=Colletotrichum destructivum TaxID=34406 RepID=A0AAX4J1U1_9PEZI|nr:hypothetical protein CDEST_14528 [Colletotrichum destructivum]
MTEARRTTSDLPSLFLAMPSFLSVAKCHIPNPTDALRGRCVWTRRICQTAKRAWCALSLAFEG